MLKRVVDTDRLDIIRKALADAIARGGHATIEIDPDTAKVMLERNTGNRPLADRPVAVLAKAMANGEWKLSGEPIIFSSDGILNDGQHRLAACVKAGVSFPTDVRFGIDRAAFRVTNSGMKRTVSQIMSIDGVSNCRAVASGLNWYASWKAGKITQRRSDLSTASMIELFRQHPKIEESAHVASQMSGRAAILPPSLVCFLHYAFSEKDRAAADEFFQMMLTGLGFDGDRDPRYLLRSRLIANKGSRDKFPDVYLAAICIKAWNAVRAGRKLTFLKWQMDTNGKGEEFPDIE